MIPLVFGLRSLDMSFAEIVTPVHRGGILARLTEEPMNSKSDGAMLKVNPILQHLDEFIWMMES